MAGKRITRKEVRKRYGLTKKDIKRYKAFCKGQIPKGWMEHRDRILTAFERMSGSETRFILKERETPHETPNNS